MKIKSMLASVLLLAAGIASAATPNSLMGNWTSTLHARDLDNDGSADAYFNSEMGVTWLAAPKKLGNGQVVDELLLPLIRSYASDFSLGGVNGWRLPALDTGPSGVGCVDFFNVRMECLYTMSPYKTELSWLFQVTLGNPVNPAATGAILNPGPFGLPEASLSSSILTDEWAVGFQMPAKWAFNTQTGTYGIQTVWIYYGGYTHTWLVHDGDVGVAVSGMVPEPSTWAMCGLGLAFVSLVALRRRT